ncbi:putative LRR receptor-like serine/threonine-protein kinase, partial [Corchorus capsularis]
MVFMAMKLQSSSKYFLFFFMVVFFIAGYKSNAQYTQDATTDPSEVSALNAIFEQWSNIQMPMYWKVGDPCSTIVARNSSDSIFEDSGNNPGIRCNCSYESNTVCHITRLRAYALNAQGVMPKELLNLTYLEFLKIDQNFFSGPLPAFIGKMSRLEF